jgi:hypothetical protein
MKLDETTLIEIQDYINELDEKVGLKPETIEDVRKAIDKHRTELKNLRLVAVMVELPDNHVCRYSKAMNQPYPRLCVDCGKPEGN